MRRRTLTLAITLATLGVLSACSHYRLGTDAKPTFATLYVEPVTTKILLPQSQALIESQVRSAFLRDGRITLVNSPEAAEATLTLKITEYRREVATQRRDDTGLARKFALTLGVDCTLTQLQPAPSRTLFERRTITVRRDAYTDSGEKLPTGTAVSGQLQAEYQALPLLADALAEKITHSVLDVW
jgi:outer membrane lipopolysaccharide assembly protein LptE/RlpB